MKVLIADDEPSVRDGLKSIIDWEKLGFAVCGEAGSGSECLQKMLTLSPDLVLLDIKMPKMHGLEVVEKAKEQGFSGRIIIISGYSDFKHAQTAIRFGVNNYLLKPIDENELEDAVKSIKAAIELEQQKSVDTDQVIGKAKESIISDIIRGKASFASGTLPGSGDVYGMKLSADSYRVVVFDRLDYAEINSVSFFSKLFSLSRLDMDAIEAVRISDRNVYLLKGSKMIEKIEKLAKETNRNAKELSGRGIFAAQGRAVLLQQDIVHSYLDATQYIHRKFFYPREICFADGPDPDAGTVGNAMISDAETRSFISRIVSLIEACNNDKASATITALCRALGSSSLPPEEIKGYLASLMIQIKRSILENHRQLSASFESDAEIISLIGSKERLYEIADYLVSGVQSLITILESYSRDHTINKVLHYIDKNYDKNLKLESLAELFGYNSAYLGKVFKSRADENFNTYLDRVRIANAKEMLKRQDIKAYEISEKVGYHNFDYFCKKFKKHTGESPSEYRKRLGISSDVESDSNMGQ